MQFKYRETVIHKKNKRLKTFPAENRPLVLFFAYRAGNYLPLIVVFQISIRLKIAA
ncbi:hypothetical protein PSP6_630043 [Paraburkholderia tropica]|nr:hypothetical protein PSP6_630043 [Paraburkholderia tropica]